MSTICWGTTFGGAEPPVAPFGWPAAPAGAPAGRLTPGEDPEDEDVAEDDDEDDEDDDEADEGGAAGAVPEGELTGLDDDEELVREEEPEDEDEDEEVDREGDIGEVWPKRPSSPSLYNLSISSSTVAMPRSINSTILSLASSSAIDRTSCSLSLCIVLRLARALLMATCSSSEY